jgi:ABC-type nitrate/sulfonate/bicarbonate transport system permease component
MESFVKAIARGVIAILIVAALWQAAAMATGNTLFMPTLAMVLGRLGQLCVSIAFWEEAWVSLQHLVLGYVPALIGIPLGLAFAAVTPLRFVFGGLVNGLAATPLIASAPLMAGWLGLGDSAKIVLVFVVAVFALTSEVMTGLARSASTGGAPDEGRGMARCIVAALRRSFVLAVTAVLVGEMLASAHGLGYLLITAMSLFDFARTAAILVVVALPCAVMAAIARGVEEVV